MKNRRPGRRQKKSGVLTTVNRSLQPFANRYICKLKYATTISTNTVGNVGQYVMNLNSLWDPDRTGTGHQPYGFDNLANLYNRYRVIATGWRVQQPSFSTSSSIITAGISSNDPNISWADTGVMLENPRTKYITQNGGAPAETLRGKIYLPKLVGRSKTQYMADDQYQATVLASPLEFMGLYLQTFSGSTGLPLGGVALQVVLEYTVEFFDSKHVVQS